MEEKIINWQDREKIKWRKYQKDCPLKYEELRQFTGYNISSLSAVCSLGEHKPCNYEKCPFVHWRDYK